MKLELIAPARLVTVSLAAALSGLTEKAIRRKIEKGEWIEGREYTYAPDGGLFVYVEAMCKWVESGQGSKRARRASGSSSSSTARQSASA